MAYNHSKYTKYVNYAHVSYFVYYVTAKRIIICVNSSFFSKYVLSSPLNKLCCDKLHPICFDCIIVKKDFYVLKKGYPLETENTPKH